MVELGKVESLEDEMLNSFDTCRGIKNNELRLAYYNYLGNLYSALSVIKNEEINPDMDKIFNNIDNYNWFIKKTDFLEDSFRDNFIENKNFHQDYLNDILINIEKTFADTFSDGVLYSTEDSTFKENEFYEVLHDFCSFFGIENIYFEIVNESRIFSMKRGEGYNDFLGLTLNNPLNGKRHILIDSFDYNLDSMFILAHEVGHYYDLGELIGSDSAIKINSYSYKSVYQEVISKLFERLFLTYLCKNNIKLEVAKDKYLDSEIFNHDFIFSAYMLSLLDDEYLIKSKYLNLDGSLLSLKVCKYFENKEVVERFLSNKELSLISDLNYSYGDILSLFLKDEVYSEKLNSLLLKKFMDIRYKEFSKEFFMDMDFTARKYGDLYKEEMQFIKR